MFDGQGVRANGLRLFSAVINIEFWSHESGPNASEVYFDDEFFRLESRLSAGGKNLSISPGLNV